MNSCLAKVSSRCWHYFPAAILVHHRCAPTWRFHTGLCKFLQNISMIIWSLGKRTGQKLGEVSYMYLFIDFIYWMGFDLFFYCVTVKMIYTSRTKMQILYFYMRSIGKDIYNFPVTRPFLQFTLTTLSKFQIMNTQSIIRSTWNETAQYNNILWYIKLPMLGNTHFTHLLHYHLFLPVVLGKIQWNL